MPEVKHLDVGWSKLNQLSVLREDISHHGVKDSEAEGGLQAVRQLFLHLGSTVLHSFDHKVYIEIVLRAKR